MSAHALVDPAERAERRARRAIGAHDRRRLLLLTAQPALRVLAFALLVAGACGVLYGWGRPIDPLVPFASALAAVAAARMLARVAPVRLGATARAEATVREAWRAVRPDADEPRPYPRHAVWAAEAADGTVGLWRLTRPAGDARAADGRYAISATLLRRLDALDTVAAAEALADARMVAERDEHAAMAEQVTVHAARSGAALRAERDTEELAARRIEARGLARALRR